MRTAYTIAASLLVGGLVLGIIGVLAWRDERAKRQRTAEEQVKRHGGVE